MLKAEENPNGEVSANKAYKMYLNLVEDSEEPKLTFKDWLANQKNLGNFLETGKTTLSNIFGKNQSTDTKNTDAPPSDPKDAKVLIWGMRPIVAVPVIIGSAVLIGWGAVKIYQYFKNKP